MRGYLPSMPRWRLAVLTAFFVAGFFLLGSRLHTIQIEETSHFKNSMRRQSVRRVLLPAPRGRIFDRNGVCLADNRPSYCIAVFVEELRKPGRWSNTVNAVDIEIDRVARILGVPRQITREDIEQHVAKRLPLPLLAWEDVSPETLARFTELVLPSNNGMDVYVQPERVYPEGMTAAHLLGYVGRDKPVVTNEFFHYNVMGMKGRSGIEAALDQHLAGTPGGRLITVDVSGYRHSETNRPPIPGKNLQLTIDIRLQKTLERLLAGHRGAAVAIDPRNGDVLALVSQPSFDPNAMSPAVSPRLWKALNKDEDRPLINRAVSGVYPPGSIFKPCVALAALDAGVPPDVTYPCNGVFTLGRMRLRCAKRSGHGPHITFRYAIEQSCNPFFCAVGVRTGIEAIDAFAAKLGFGKRSGIVLRGEAAGLLPDDAWKRRTGRGGWRTGDTANLSIGQGFLLVTPLQIGLYTAALANCGTLYQPRLILAPESEPGKIVRKIPIPQQHLEIVRGGMYDVINSAHGSGRRARVPGIAIAGKTGTAEYGPRSARRKHTWMISFAPYDEPRLALAILVEDGVSGGRTVGPMIAETMRSFFPELVQADSVAPVREEAPAPDAGASMEGTEEEPPLPQEEEGNLI